MESKTSFNPTKLLNHKGVSEETFSTIINENLLTEGLLQRLHKCYTQHSGIVLKEPLFTEKERYAGLRGFREILDILGKNGIQLSDITERELFIDVYRFMATKHVLNSINWDKFEKDSLFQLVFPQPGMINEQTVREYKDAGSDEKKKEIVSEYIKKTNPHDGKQKLNKPWYINEDGHLEILQGVQHKYPVCQLVFDKTTQNCFAFCNYCFRHAQVRGDEDMFNQEDITQVIEYLEKHPEVNDVLITGGDAGYITYERLEQYALPLIENEKLLHIKTLRLGTRVLTFQPEMILSKKFDKHLELFRKLKQNGVQVMIMAHFSTPHEILNPFTIAAINRLRYHEVSIRSQSPIMKHISLFTNDDGKIDVERSAQNWIDLGNILAMLGVGFHSMYCARPTGEHHYFTAALSDIDRVFSKVYLSLPSINRPSRYITMTSSAGKVSLIGVAEIEGKKVFVLKFNEGRNMEWLSKVYLAEYDEEEHTIENLKPYKAEKHFYEYELTEIEEMLDSKLRKAMENQK
jgi:lysine 2,3-aminomutase